MEQYEGTKTGSIDSRELLSSKVIKPLPSSVLKLADSIKPTQMSGIKYHIDSTETLISSEDFRVLISSGVQKLTEGYKIIKPVKMDGVNTGTIDSDATLGGMYCKTVFGASAYGEKFWGKAIHWSIDSDATMGGISSSIESRLYN